MAVQNKRQCGGRFSTLTITFVAATMVIAGCTDERTSSPDASRGSTDVAPDTSPESAEVAIDRLPEAAGQDLAQQDRSVMCDGDAAAAWCAYGTPGGRCDDFKWPAVCRDGAWRCEAFGGAPGGIPADQCSGFGSLPDAAAVAPDTARD